MPAVGLKSASSTGRVRLAKYQVVLVKDACAVDNFTEHQIVEG
jgi:nicotinamidase-related amidase